MGSSDVPRLLLDELEGRPSPGKVRSQDPLSIGRYVQPQRSTADSLLAELEPEKREDDGPGWATKIGLGLANTAAGFADVSTRTLGGVLDLMSAGGEAIMSPFVEPAGNRAGVALSRALSGGQSDTLSVETVAKGLRSGLGLDPNKVDEGQQILRETLGEFGYTGTRVAGEIAGLAAPIPGAAFKAGATLTKPVGQVLGAAATKAASKSSGRMARLLEGTGRALPSLAGEYGGFMAQSYLAAAPQERLDALVHTAVAGPLMIGLIRGGRAIEQATLSRLVGPETQAKIIKAIEDGKGEAAINEIIGGMRLLAARGAGASVESGGFTLLQAAQDPQFRKDMAAAINGDDEAIERVSAAMLGTVAGVLGAKYMIPHDQIPFWRAKRPDLNDGRVWLEAKKAREDAAEAEVKAKADAEAAEQQGKEQRAQEAESRAPKAEEGVIVSTRPLFRGGWHPLYVQQTGDGRQIWPMRYGQDQFTVRHDGSTLQVDVPAETYRRVTGNEATSDVTLVGDAAQKFVDDAALAAATARAVGQYWIGRDGAVPNKENDAWIEPDGAEVGIDMRGNVFERRNGEYRDTGAAPKMETEQTWDHPMLAEWQKLADAMRLNPDSLTDNAVAVALHSARTGPVDVPINERVVMDMQRGGSGQFAAELMGPPTPAQQSSANLREFLATTDPRMLAQGMTPESGRKLALELVSLANGTQSLEGARASFAKPIEQLKAELAGEARKVLEQVTSEQAAEAPKSSADIAGEKDWRAIRGTPEGRQESIEAARRWAEAQRAEGNEPTPAEMRRIFGIDKATGRKVADEPPPRKKGEEGFVITPTAEEARTLIDRATLPARAYTGIATERLAKAGPKSRELARRFEKASSRAQTFRGEFTEQKQKFESTMKGQEEFLAQQQSRGTFGTPMEGFVSNLTEMAHGRPVKDATPETVAAVRTVQDITASSGKKLRDVGGMRVVERGGQKTAEPSAHSETGEILPRRPTDEWTKKMRTDPQFQQAFTQHLAAGNNLPHEAVAGMLKPLWKKVDVTPTERLTAQEQVRTLKYFPDSVKVGDKETKVLDTDPYRAVESMIEGTAQRASVVEEFGPDLPGVSAAERQRLGIEKPGMEDTIREYVEKSGEATVDSQKMAEFLKDQSAGNKQDLGRYEPVYRALEVPFSVIRRLKTLFSPALDVFDPLIGGPVTMGWRRTVKAYQEMGLPFTQAWRQARMDATRDGALLEAVAENPKDPNRSVMARIKNFLSAPHMWSESAKQTLYHRGSKRLLETWAKNGEGTLSDVFSLREVLGFSEADAASLMSGKASPELQAEFRHRLVGRASGDIRAGQGSTLREDKRFNHLWWFNRFFMSRLNLTAKVFTGSAKWMFGPNRTPAERALGAKKLMSYLVGGAISGHVGTLIYELFKGNTPADVWRDMTSGGVAHFMKRLGQQAAAGMAGGLPAQVARDLFTERPNPQDISPAFSAAWEIYTAVTGKGDYARLDLEGSVLRAMERLGGSPVRSALAVTGIRGSTKADAAFRLMNRWKAENNIPFPEGGMPKNLPAWQALEEAELAIKRGDMEAARAAADKALLVQTGQNAAQGLRQRIGLRELSIEQMDSLRDFMGDENMLALQAYDQMLKDLAREVSRKPGTQGPRASVRDDLDKLAEASQQGIHYGWRELTERVVAYEAQKSLSGKKMLTPDEDSYQVYDTFSHFPEAFEDVLTDFEKRAVEAKQGGDMRTLMRSILHRRVRERVESELAKKRKDAREKRK